MQVTSNFSFLRGASHPDELVDRALELGYKAIALTDRNSLVGIVRAHVAAKGKEIQFVPACRLDLQDGPSLLAYPTDQKAYEALSALLSKGNLRTEKGDCRLYKEDVFELNQGMQFVLVPPIQLNRDMNFDTSFITSLHEYKEAFGERLYMAANRSYQSEDLKRLFRIADCSKKVGMQMLATNDVHYHQDYRRELQDVLTCVREKCTIHTAGYRLYPNRERHLKTVDEMYRLFTGYEEAIEHGLQQR